MATQVTRQGRASAAGRTARKYQEFSITRLLLPSGGAVALALALVAYLHTFALTTGLDSTSSVYRTHWYTLLAAEMMIVVPAVMLAVRRLARSKCEVCVDARARGGRVPTRHELGHFWTLFGLVIGASVSGICTPGLVGMHDVAMHSATLRDTSLSPVHIEMFFGMAPVTVGLVVASFIYGRTRLPEVWGRSKGIPAAYLIAGSGWAFTMLFFGLNDFAHTQWIPEERLSTPYHFAFMVPFWSTLAILSPLLAELPRIHRLVAETEQTDGLPGSWDGT